MAGRKTATLNLRIDPTVKDAVDGATFAAFYVMLSYFLTGEHRPYSLPNATFSRPHPRKNVLRDGWGAWEIAARYSFLDLDSRGVEGGVLHDWTLGLNWYLNHHTRLMFNYILSHPEGLDLAHIWQFRWQLTF